MINQAEREYNKVIPEAKGQAQGMIKQAEGYAADRTNRAYGDVAKFNALLAEYKKAPEVTRNRLYLEAMETILPQAGKKLVVDSSVPNLIPLVNDTSAEKVKPSEKNADQTR